MVKNIHVGVGHPALKDILEAGNAVQSLTGEAQHRRQQSNCRRDTAEKGFKRIGGRRMRKEKKEEGGE